MLGLEQQILKVQRNEITEYWIYKTLAANAKESKNRDTLSKIAEDEFKHYKFWKTISLKDTQPNHWKFVFYYNITRFLGLNFGIRLMERGEDLAQKVYGELKTVNPVVNEIIADEEEHESKLLEMVDKNELKYVSSIILGLNDALVELTGVLAGLTLALQDARLIAIVGVITGIAAALSMTASGYLSSKEEENKNPIKSSIYTGLSYIITVVILILPYLFLENHFLSLAVVLLLALLIIFLFNFYISVAKNLSFRKRFLEMAVISLGVAALNFLIGMLVRRYFKVET